MNIDTIQADTLQLLKRYQGEGYFPDAVLSVCRKDGNLYRQKAGAVHETTLFDVASLTKIATSTMVLLAIEEGRMSLESELLSLLPELGQDEALRERLSGITVSMLLTHTSTLPDWYPFYIDGREFPLVLKAACLNTKVNEMVYSDINFILLGKVLERLHGLPLDSCLEEKLVVPYHLGRMMYRPKFTENIAPSSWGNPIEEDMCRERGLTFSGWRPHTPLRGEVNDGNAHYYFNGVSGHAGIFADAAAYEALLLLYLNTSSPLLISSMEEHAPTRGLGWQKSDLYPFGCGHTGFTGTSVYLSKEKNIGCVLFTNRLFYPDRNTHLTHDARRALHTLLADHFS